MKTPDVLIVEDHPDASGIILAILRQGGITGHCVSSGTAALAWLKKRQPSLVILDLMLPDISGVEVLKTIRADPDLAKLPVVLHSVLDGDEVRDAAAKFGANGFLLKGRYTVVDVMKIIGQLSPDRPRQ